MSYAKQTREIALYAFGHCESWLESCAYTHQVSVQELTYWVAELLLHQGTWAENRMPTLPRNSSKIRSPLEQVEVVKRTRRHSRRGSSPDTMRNYWQKNFPTPEARSKEMKRRLLLSAKRKAA